MWWDCGVAVVEAEDVEKAAYLAGVSPLAVRGPYEALALLHADRRLHRAMERSRQIDREAASADRARARSGKP